MGMNACGCLDTSFSKAQSNRASTDASPSPSLGQRKQLPERARGSRMHVTSVPSS